MCIGGEAMRFVMISMLVVLFASPCAAEPLTPVQQLTLDQTRDRFAAAMQERDYGILVEVIPPKLVNHIAASAGVTEAELHVALTQVLVQTMNDVTFTKMDMVTEGLEASSLEHDGEAYVWGFAPTYIEMIYAGQNFEVDEYTLVLLEAGVWYLIRTSEAEKIAMLRSIYPFFNDVVFP